jgi:hypothetical protein
MILAIQFLGLFLAIWFTSVNIVNAYYNKNIPTMNFILMSLGWTTFIFPFLIK